MKATLKNAWGYRGDKMNLPVADVDANTRFYSRVMGFRIESLTEEAAQRSAVLERDGIRMGLAENGGDPSQDGCAFEVDDVESLYNEFYENGLTPAGPTSERGGTISPELKFEKHEDGSDWKIFFVVAPDELCFWFGQRQ